MKFINRDFTLIDFSTSHNQFLYRSSKNEKFNRNIDILFEGVSFMQLPLNLYGFEIVLGNKNDYKELKKIVPDLDSYSHKKMIVLQNNLIKNFCLADRISYQENDLEALETSIPIKTEEPLSDEDILKMIEEASEKGADFLMQKYNKNDWTKIL